MDSDQVPAGGASTTPTITGVGRVTKFHDAKYIRITTSVWDRKTGRKRSIDLILERDIEVKHKRQPPPSDDVVFFFSGNLQHQQQTGKVFVVELTEYKWVLPCAFSAPAPPPSAVKAGPSTPTKPRALGKRKESSSLETQASSTKKPHKDTH